MDISRVLLVAALLAVLSSTGVHAAHSPIRRSGSRHVKRHLEEFLEPPPPPRGSLHKVVRARRGNWPESPPPAMSLGERIARWFYSGPSESGPKSHGNKGPANLVDLTPPPMPPMPVPIQHSAPPAPPPDFPPASAEAVALTQQKPPPPQSHAAPPAPAPAPVYHSAQPPAVLDSHMSGTEHHPAGLYPPRPQNYPVLTPQSYVRSSDCNTCNDVPWIPMSRTPASASDSVLSLVNSPSLHGDSYGPPGGQNRYAANQAGDPWGQASDAIPLAQPPIPFPTLHKGPLPPVFPADDFSHIPPAPANQPPSLRDHLVPPTPEHDSVVFTINEEKGPQVSESLSQNELSGLLATSPDHLKAAQDHDQQHQGSQNVAHGPHPGPSIFNPQPFGPQIFGYHPYSASKGVELVQSVPVASYLASIEYPMTYIQSPLIEIPVKTVSAPHGFASPQNTASAPLSPYKIVAPTPHAPDAATGESSLYGKEKHAGALPLQGEGADSSPAATISNHNIPPCRDFHRHNSNYNSQSNHDNHHQDAIPANSQNTNTYVQEIPNPRFESHKLIPEAVPSNHKPNSPKNNYRLLDDASTVAIAAWPSTTTALPPTSISSWGTDETPSSAVTINGFSPAPQKTGGSTKKTKQIQIIVPYTIDKENGQVQFHSELTPDQLGEGLLSTPTGLEAFLNQGRKVPSGVDTTLDLLKTNAPRSVANGKDLHQAQESVVVAELSPTPWQGEETTPPVPDTRTPTSIFAGLQHILATDIRSLLKNEEDSVDRLRLQKTIDNWTAQEYSSKSARDTEDQEAVLGSASNHTTTLTTASFGSSSVHGKFNPSKKIPKEYLTTTPLSISTNPTSTTQKPTTQHRGYVMFESTKIRSSKASTSRNSTRDDRKTKNGWTLIDNLIVPGPASASSSTPTPTPHPSIDTFDAETTDHTHAPWERLQVSISPITQEKVYVVTPLNVASDETSTDSGIGYTASKSINDLSPFRQWMDSPTTTTSRPSSTSTASKRPRFSIRPTPGWPKPRPQGFRSSTMPTTGGETSVTLAPEKAVTKTSRPTPRGFAVETISGHSKVFTATTSVWSKKKANEGEKKSTTAKPTTTVSRTTRDLKMSSVTSPPVTTKDLSDIEAQASASILHKHVAQLFPLVQGRNIDAVDKTTYVTPSTTTVSAQQDAKAPIDPEIVIVEAVRTTNKPRITTPFTTDTPLSTEVELDAETSTEISKSLQRTTRGIAIKTIGRRDGVRYILSPDEEQVQPDIDAILARTKLQAIAPKKYESPPPRPKSSKPSQTLYSRRPSRRPPHLIMTPEKGSYMWNFPEFTGSHEDMAESDVAAIKGTVLELQRSNTTSPQTNSTILNDSRTTVPKPTQS